MQFYEHTDYFQIMKKMSRHFEFDGDDYTDPQSFYGDMIESSQRLNDVFTYRQSMLELDWINHDKPYYNIYPAISPLVDKLKLDIPCSAISPPEGTLCLRLPVGNNNPYKAGDSDIRTVLFGIQQTRVVPGSDKMTDGLVILFDAGERGEHGTPIYVFKIFPLEEGLSIEQATKSLPHHRSWNYGVKIDDGVVEAITKLCVAVCLIGQNPDLVCPDVLSKDRVEYLNCDPERKKIIEARAKRKGKNGYNIGQGLESCPHYRRSHLATIPVGKGRSSYKVIMRKGSIVRREKIISIPSGYDANED